MAFSYLQSGGVVEQVARRAEPKQTTTELKGEVVEGTRMVRARCFSSEPWRGGMEETK